MRIVLDATPITVVVVCECGARTIAADRAEAWQAAADHARRVHGDVQTVKRALRNVRRFENGPLRVDD